MRPPSSDGSVFRETDGDGAWPMSSPSVLHRERPSSYARGAVMQPRPPGPQGVHVRRRTVARSTRVQTTSWPIPGRSGTAIRPSADTTTGGSTRSSSK